MKKIAITTYLIPSNQVNHKKLRGVVGQNLYLSTTDYSGFIFNGGGFPTLLPIFDNDKYIDQICDDFDALLLSGGEDSDPSTYNQIPHPNLGTTVKERDIFELKLLDKFLLTKKPILAICRGMQLLNIYFGGTIFQDFSIIDKKLHYHCENRYKELIHKVNFKQKFIDIYDKEEMRVNSHHHQFIDKIGSNLKVGAIAPDGIIEALYSDKYPQITAVQWHPEMLYDIYPIELKLSKYFIHF